MKPKDAKKKVQEKFGSRECQPQLKADTLRHPSALSPQRPLGCGQRSHQLAIRRPEPPRVSRRRCLMKRRSFDPEFKLAAVRMVTEGGRRPRDVARDLEIRP